jgi:hypothetical protein
MRGPARRISLSAILLEPEIDVLLKFLELRREPSDLELELFDFPVDLAQLVFEPVDPDEEICGIGLLTGIGHVARAADLGWRASVSLRIMHRDAAAFRKISPKVRAKIRPRIRPKRLCLGRDRRGPDAKARQGEGRDNFGKDRHSG